MAETAELHTLIGDITTGVADLRTKMGDLDSMKTRLDAAGIPESADELMNLKSITGKLADLEVKVGKLRHARSLEGKDTTAFEDNLDEDILDEKESRQRRITAAMDKVGASAGYRKAFNRALRKGGDKFTGLTGEDRQILHFEVTPKGIDLPTEIKAGLSSDFNPSGGLYVPPTVEREITRMVIESSPMERFVRTVNIGSAEYVGTIRNTNRDGVVRRGEREGRTSRTESNRFKEKRIRVFDAQAEPALTATLLEDSEVDLAAELQMDASEDFSRDMGIKIIRGDGVTEPGGLLTNSDATVVPSGSAATFDMNSLRKLPFRIKGDYSNRASYVLSRSALELTMLFRDGSGGSADSGQYLWQPSAQDGAPSRLNGFEWAEMVDLDAVAANAFPVLFGDWPRAYRLVRRRGLKILRDELTEKPFIVFFMTMRWGGDVWLAEAYVKLKCATS